MPPPEDPAERLVQLRYHMQGADVPVALFGWMKEVETQLINQRALLRRKPLRARIMQNRQRRQ